MARHDRLVWPRHAMLRHAEGASRPARPQRRQGRPHHLQDRGPRLGLGQRPPSRTTVRGPALTSGSTSAGWTNSNLLSIPIPRCSANYQQPNSAHGRHRARFCSICGPKFCSTKITQNARDYGAFLNDPTGRYPERVGADVIRIQGDKGVVACRCGCRDVKQIGRPEHSSLALQIN